MKHQVKSPPLNLNLKAGFTLIELLIYIGLYAVLISVIVAIFGSVLESRTQTEQLSAVSMEGERILAKLQHDVKRANQVLLPDPIGNASQTLSLLIGTDTLTYSLSETGQLMFDDGLDEQPLSNLTNLDNFQVTRVGNVDGKDAVFISFDMQTNNLLLGQPETRNFQTVVVTR